jgi:hypothetical protein
LFLLEKLYHCPQQGVRLSLDCWGSNLNGLYTEVETWLRQYEFPDLIAQLESMKALAWLSISDIEKAEDHAFRGLQLAAAINHYVFDRLVERLEIDLGLWEHGPAAFDLESLCKRITAKNSH